MAGIHQHFSATGPLSSRDDSRSQFEDDGPTMPSSTLDGNSGGASTSLTPQAKHPCFHA